MITNTGALIESINEAIARAVRSGLPLPAGRPTGRRRRWMSLSASRAVRLKMLWDRFAALPGYTRRKTAKGVWFVYGTSPTGERVRHARVHAPTLGAGAWSRPTIEVKALSPEGRAAVARLGELGTVELG